ncbi:hypothetical protein CAPTEDRAFT_180694 [Capitella teleta]|uniref:Beta-hexosaminidase n=1 Tax=Capitella teleta TaxID=283909 RepID=R7TQ17_CAPTE|nr:hypothetical protein CAPTEDRAFT_180694 [Capitella teleta]|eukprot:ELT93601.1 hypothetical protein CAPTEDRAFT_180694 [Capitella teleta]
MPQSWSPTSKLYTLDPDSISFDPDLTGCDVIEHAIEECRRHISLNAGVAKDPDLPEVERIQIQVEDQSCEGYPKMEDSEAYELSVEDNYEILLSADSIWGVVRGLETLSQLVYTSEQNTYLINETTIEDFPRFQHRSLMIDTARHFLSVSVILKIIDAMSWDKFNVLHWHVVDDQSFPYPSRTFPELQEKGAYTPYHMYTQSDVTLILNEARLRGIRVIPEFDTPGHTWSWGQSHPELITPCWGKGLEGGPNVPNFPEHGAEEIVNPMLETTYSFLEELFREIVADFPDEYIHLGMDEVYYACWKSNPNITQWMEEMEFGDYAEVEQYYSNRLINITEELGSKYIIWQDPIDNNVTVDMNTLVTIWKDSKNNQDDPWQMHMEHVAKKGYKMLLSAPWYLNVITYGEDFREYYAIEPTNFTTDPELQALVVGGEACIWAEYLDGTNILSLLWPRASAIAERLWSAKEVNDIEEAKYRLDQQRCRMLRRGIPTKPIMNGYCGDYEWEFDEDHAAGSSASDAVLGHGALLFCALLLSAIAHRFG